MSISLNKDKLISLYLSRLIPIDIIRFKIIKYKTMLENKESLEYHIERWETISSKYFRSFEINQYNQRQPYSYIHDDIYYISLPDKNMDYYNETGISFQTRDMLLEIISYPTSVDWYKTGICKRSIIKNQCIEYRKKDDERYSILSNEIMKKNKIYIDINR